MCTYVWIESSTCVCVVLVYVLIVYVLIVSIVWRGTCWSNINHRSFKIQLRVWYTTLFQNTTKHNKTQQVNSNSCRDTTHNSPWTIQVPPQDPYPTTHSCSECLPRWAHSTTPGSRGKSLEISSAVRDYKALSQIVFWPYLSDGELFQRYIARTLRTDI